jgi:serine/threonine protein kinase
MIGRTVSHYKILSKLGEGGMGVVYKAHDTKLDRDVALKFLPHYLTSDPTEKERFYHEARAAAALTHQNIAVIHEIGEHENQLFIAMEYVEGKTLKQLVESETLSVKKVLDIAIQVCEGLAAAHEKGIVHRDIKSDNIIVTAKGQAKIMDFGLAKVKGATKLTKAGSTLGTAAYMSPEQARGEEVDQRSDIFSFGVVLYELFTSKLPFRGEHEAALMYAIFNEEPQPIARFNEKVTPELQHIVSKALAKDTDERYQHVDDLLADLKSVRRQFESGAITGKPISPYRKLKIPWYAYASVAILIVILVLSKISLFGPTEKPITSVAVLPFQNLSKDPEQEYFSDGMTEALISELSKIKALRVISRTSVMRFKKTDKSLPEIASELGVDAVVEGSVQRVQDNVRITAQLVKAQPEQHLWANDFNRAFKDVLILQSEVAQAIAHEIRITVTPEEQRRLSAGRAVDPEAYEAYLKGRFFINKFNETDVRRGMSFFEQAVARDSSYALAYEGLAEGYDMLVGLGGMSSEDGIPKMRTWAMKALSIDQSLAAAYTIIGEIGCYEWNWQSAEENYRRATELNQNYAAGHAYYAFYLSLIKRYDESVSEAKQAVELDPLWPMTKAILAYALFYDHQYENAMMQVNEALSIDSTFALGYGYRGCFYLWQGNSEEAIVQFQKSIAFGDYQLLAFLAYTYARSDNVMKAREILADQNTKYIQPSLLGIVYVGLGDWDLAFEYMEKAYKEKDSFLLVCVSIPKGFDTVFDRFRTDPRFAALVKKMGLEEIERRE